MRGTIKSNRLSIKVRGILEYVDLFAHLDPFWGKDFLGASAHLSMNNGWL